MDATPSYIQQIMTEKPVNTADAAVQTQGVLKGFTTITWYQIAGCIWVAGVIAFIFYHGRKHFRFIKMVNRWGEQTINPQVFEALQRIKNDIGVAKGVRLQICSYVSSPMVLGFISPVILLPQADFSMDELSHILRHELLHLKRKDLKNRIFSIMDTTKKKAGVTFLCLILIGTVCAGVAFAARTVFTMMANW